MARNYAVATSFTANDRGIIGAFKRMNNQARSFEKNSKTAFGRASMAGSRAGDVMKGIIGADLIGRGIQLAGSVVRLTGEFERYNAVLKNTLGSQEAATAAMNDIQTFAATTPFQLNELVGSYIKLTNRGMQPTMATMSKLGDIAASQGKSFDQLTEAILDATSGGGFERLKEFGIKASKNAGMVEFSFKGMTKTVADSPQAINDALLAFADLEGVAGGMDAISKTLEGRISNLQDSFSTLAVKLGRSMLPIMEGVVNILIATAPALEQLIPLLPVLVGGWLAYNAAVRAHIALGAIQYAFKFVRVMMIMARTKGLMTTAQWALNVAMSANPIGAVIIAITALIAVGVLLYKNWDLVKRKFMEWTAVFDNPIFATVASVMAPFITIPLLIARNWDAVTGSITKAINFAKSGVSSVKSFLGIGEEEKAAASSAPNAKQAEARASQGRVGIDMNIAGAPSGSTVKTRNKNVDFNAQLMGANP